VAVVGMSLFDQGALKGATGGAVGWQEGRWSLSCLDGYGETKAGLHHQVKLAMLDFQSSNFFSNLHHGSSLNSAQLVINCLI